MQLTARDIAEIIGGKLSGNPEETVTGLAGIKEAQPGDLSFVGSPKYFAALKTTRASVVILAADAKVESDRTLIRVDNPSQAFAKVVERTLPPPVRFKPGVHPTAVIAPTSKLGKEIGRASCRERV